HRARRRFHARRRARDRSVPLLRGGLRASSASIRDAGPPGCGRPREYGRKRGGRGETRVVVMARISYHTPPVRPGRNAEADDNNYKRAQIPVEEPNFVHGRRSVTGIWPPAWTHRAILLMSERSIDQRLVARVQKGDKTAFDLLVRKYQHKVAKLVARYVRDRGEIEDVTQEAFIKAYRAIGGFRGESAFYTWLYRIAVNTAKNYLDSQSRRPPSNDIEVEGAELIESGESLRDQATPERTLLTDEIAATVNRVIESLPDEIANR